MAAKPEKHLVSGKLVVIGFATLAVLMLGYLSFFAAFAGSNWDLSSLPGTHFSPR